jgi:hypothetical protein
LVVVVCADEVFGGSAVAAPEASDASEGDWCDDELIDPLDPSLSSARAVCGNATTVPTPSATANAPTRPI